MAILRLFHSADPEALLAAAAEPFHRPNSGAALPLLAVRQGGVRDEVVLRAAAAGSPGWLGSPLVVFAELPALLAGEMAPLSSFERRVILERLVREARLPELSRVRDLPSFIASLDALFGDFVSERLSAGDVEERLAKLQGDGWEARRDAELSALYASYLQAVAELPAVDGERRSDGRDALAIAADVVRTRPEEVRERLRAPFADASERRAVRIYGLADLRHGWDLLLDALHASDVVSEVCLYVLRSEGDEESVEAALWRELMARSPDEVVRVLDRPRPRALSHLGAHLFAPSTSLRAQEVTGREVTALAAPDMARELENVAREVKRLIAEEGVKPASIAIVSRKARPYATRAAELLRRNGVPVTSRLRMNLLDVPVVGILCKLLQAAGSGWDRARLLEIAESSYFDLYLDTTLLRRIGSRRRLVGLDTWQAALRSTLSEAREGVDRDDYHGPEAERVERALESFERFAKVARDLTTDRSLGRWLDLTLAFLGSAPSGDRARADDAPGRAGIWNLCRNACRPPMRGEDPIAIDAARFDGEAIRALVALLADWRRALAHDSDAHQSLTAAEWHRTLTAALEDEEIALWTPHRRGVHVLEATAALGRTFEHVFIVGMSTGAFPAEPGERPFYADEERQVLYGAGLPLEPNAVWFEREASLFRAIAAGARSSLHLSYAYADASGAPQLPSAYFDEVTALFADRAGEPGKWVRRIAGSALVPESLEEVRCPSDLLLYAADGWHREAPRRDSAKRALAHLVSTEDQAALIARVLHVAGVGFERAELRRKEIQDRTKLAHAWNGAIGDEDLLAHLGEQFGDERIWSASMLETYGRCAFNFFSKYVLRLGTLAEPDEELNGAGRGQMLHLILQRLHDSLASELGNDALTSRALKRAERLIETAVRRTVEEFAKQGLAGPEVLLRYRERELRETVSSYLRWEIEQNEKPHHTRPPRRRPLRTEVAFGMNGNEPVKLQRRGRTLQVRGSIDRVDEIIAPGAEGYRYVVDHKSGISALHPVEQYEYGAILQLPLYMHVLDRLDGGEGLWGGAYQLAKPNQSECKRTAALHLWTMVKAGPKPAPDEKEDSAPVRFDEALDRALAHVDAIRGGVFPARMVACCKECPSYCDFQDVCREEVITPR